MYLLKGISANKILGLIVTLSLTLNTIGLYPNTLLHPNEPGLVGIADQLVTNIIFYGNPDPDLKPDPFKYASFLFYTQALARGLLIVSTYPFVEYLDLDFGFNKTQLVHKDFYDYVTNVGPYVFRAQVLWISRFVNALYGTGCVILVYLISQKLFRNRRLSLLSALTLAVMPHHVRDAHYATADLPLSFFILLSFLFTIKLWKEQTLANLLLAGFFAGFASALKYYPLALVPLFIVLLSFGLKIFLKRIFLVIFSGILGYIFAMPYIFVHYDKIFAFVPYVLWWQAPDQLVANRPFFSRFLPTYYHHYPLKFLFKEAILPFPFILGILSTLIGFTKYHFKFLLVFSIPFFHFVFINFYVKQIYEYLLIPMLPYFAIMIGICLEELIKFFKNRLKPEIGFIATSVLIFFALIPSFNYSLSSGLACSKDITDYQARDWILKNIPEKSYVAYHKGTRHPSMEMNWIETDILGDFSLSEIQEKNARYMIFIDGYTSIYTYWSTDFFVPPKNSFNNQYVQLVDNEFAQQTKLLAKFQKPYLCAGNTITIYQIPSKLSSGQTEIFSNNLNSIEDFRKFNFLGEEETQIAYETSQGHLDHGSIRFTTPHKLYNDFRNTYFYYSTPILSESIPVTPGKKYTMYGWIKPETTIKKSQRDGYLRLDFYSEKNPDPISVNLSPKANTSLEWQELKVTGTAPEGAKYFKFGFQSLSIEDNQSFLLDDFTVFSD